MKLIRRLFSAKKKDLGCDCNCLLSCDMHSRQYDRIDYYIKRGENRDVAFYDPKLEREYLLRNVEGNVENGR